MPNPYTTHYNQKRTKQTDPIPGREAEMVANHAGGYTFALTPLKQLERFLILGTEGATYYASEKQQTITNIACLQDCLQQDPMATVQLIMKVSEQGRAPKNDAAIFALALASRHPQARAYAYAALPQVCRTGTHLFQFCEAVKAVRGWGRGVKRAVGEWYTQRDPGAVAYQLIKYRQRNGWTHRDVLRLAKPAGVQGEMCEALRWAVGKPVEHPHALIDAFQRAQATTDPKAILQILRDCPSLPWEALPTEVLGHPSVWEALLPTLPMTAMIRNLGRMSSLGLLTDLSSAAVAITRRLGDEGALKKARIHPISVLSALSTYQQGQGQRGNLTWKPVGTITDALEDAFYLAFEGIEPSGKKTMLALDVSGSMAGGPIAGVPGLTPRQVSAVMAMVTARREPQHMFTAFSHTLVGVKLTARQNLATVLKILRGIPMGGTDCSLPMKEALANKIPVETFVIYTDNETYAGVPHPVQALKRYREVMGIPAKLIVVGLTATKFTIADPKDGGMLDVAGFDSAAPAVMAAFAKGE